MKVPVVTVIMPAYRCVNTITRAIESVLEQKVPLELFVLNDCSPDNLDEVMEKFREMPNLHYIKNEVNMGVSKTRNKGTALAKGEFIAFLDADDWWAEGKLEKQLAMLEKKQAVLCCTARALMTPEGSLTGKVIHVNERITYNDLLHHNSVSCSSVLIRTSVMKEFPMRHDDSHEDYITWLQILRKYKSACGINEPLLKYRLSNTGKSGNKLKSAGMTFKVYRYMGFGLLKSIYYFCWYAVHGILKYR